MSKGPSAEGRIEGIYEVEEEGALGAPMQAVGRREDSSSKKVSWVDEEGTLGPRVWAIGRRKDPSRKKVSWVDKEGALGAPM